MTTTESPTLTRGTWAIEPMHSEVGFTVRYPGMSKVCGCLNAEPHPQMTSASTSASGTIKRSDFGIDFSAPLGMDGMLISDKVAIELEIQPVPAS